MQNDHLFVRHYENKIGELWFLGYSIAKYQTSLIKMIILQQNKTRKEFAVSFAG